jgi:serine protease Do
MRQFLLGLGVSVIIIFSALGGALADRWFYIRPLDAIVGRSGGQTTAIERKTIVNEDSVVTTVAETASPSVVTVAAVRDTSFPDTVFLDPFGSLESERGEIQKDIGSGFVVDEGIIVTNKHVVIDPGLRYIVIDAANEEHQVTDIYRDPVNDLAILRISGEAQALRPLELGDSSLLRVGQSVIAIGTALGEFRHTVTTGVISGLGRGISAGDPFAGFIEKLENVIQTDAAINPGNSGGPLLNYSGQAIGVSVAVADRAQNIGFAIPINVVRESLDNFNSTGQFDRAYLGVRYQMISREVAVLNSVPEGAFIREVLPDSPAAKIGLKVGDIIISVDDQPLVDIPGGLASVIDQHSIGDAVSLEIDRDGEILNLRVILEAGS